MTQRGLRRPSDEQRRVVEYWRLLELFSPQPIDRSAGSTQVRRVTDRTAGATDLPPWAELPEPAPAHNGRQRTWRHTVYLGVYDISALFEHLHATFPSELDAYAERTPGESACAAFLVDGEGRYVPGSVRLSSAVWGVARTTNPGIRDPRWGEGLAEAEENLVRTFDNAFAGEEGEEPPAGASAATEVGVGTGAQPPTGSSAPVLEASDLADALARAQRAAGLKSTAGVATDRVRIISQVVGRSTSRQRSEVGEFLNSLLLDDLLTVSREEWGPALRRYLAPRAAVDVSTRVDIAPDPETAGPAAVQRGLEALLDGTRPERIPAGRWPSDPSQHLATSQQFAVNELAAVPAGTATDEQAVHGVNGPPGTGKTTLLRDAVAAVVVKRAKALMGFTRPEDAFRRLEHTWTVDGYRRAVRELQPELTGYEMLLASSNNDAVKNVSDELPLRKAMYDPARSTDYFSALATGIAWHQRVEDERAQGRRERGGRGQGGRRQGGEGPGAAGEVPADRPDCWGLVAARLGNKANRTSFQSAFWFGQETASAEEPAFDGFMKTIKGWKDGAGERPSWVKARQGFREAERAVDRLLAERGEAQRRLDQLAGRRGRSSSGQEPAGRSGEELRRQVEIDARRWGAAHPTGAWLADPVARQLRAPWLDEALDRARSTLFLRALDLQRAFLANASAAQDGLLASLEVVVGAAPRDLPAKARLAAWQLFFVVVPLVSTTFSSAGRLLAGLEAESLGWLFVDEAGQAPPQAAVGAIWRAQHVLAVGDPMQLTPVVSTPQRMQQELAAATRVDEEWVPSLSSVQHLADRLSRCGTHFGGGGSPLWVSQPLRVHRRCSSPMYGISNRIAYLGKMIDGVGARPDMSPDVYHSGWFDVPAQRRGSHLQKAEIERVRAALRYLTACEVSMSRLIVVSPFRDVSQELKSLAAEREHQGIIAGTVHTAQGKEADVVLFVLGGDPAKDGAKAWASATPNLVNVAVSRAKHRFYVIGDREAWQGYRYFATLAAELPVVPPGGSG